MNSGEYGLIKKICFAVIIICLVLLAVLFVRGRDEDKKTAEMVREKYIERTSEAKEEASLREDLAQLEENYFEQTKGVATGEWVVTQLNAAVYTNMYPLAKRFDARLVLGLSEKEFPGNVGKITTKQFAELVKNGWETSLVYDGATELSEWINIMKEKLRSVGAELPRTVYFEYGEYKPEYDPILLEAGFETLVHHGEDDMPMTGLEIDENGLWKVGCINWNGGGVDKVLDALAAGGYNLAFTVDFKSDETEFTEAAFEEMLEYIAPAREKGMLNVTGFAEARASVKKRLEDNREKRAEYESKKHEIEVQLGE